MSDNDQWYFAYGSNLSLDQKIARSGDIRSALSCFLRNYRLAFNKKSYKNDEVFANIIPATGEIVWGVAYLCNNEALRKMDICEGVAGGHYERFEVEVLTTDEDKLRAVTYVAGYEFLTDEKQPTADYLNKIISGAQQHKLPPDYIESIRQLGKK
jgi:gamma-glutamylcyclotransferase (GGCT)/AIG2-like uncharacterized protein YtfP